MSKQKENIDLWLTEILPKHERLTNAVMAITQNLLTARKIDFLAVTGRTKSKDGAFEKIERKSYKSPQSQLTDLSGIRIIVYLESDLEKVCSVISQSFHVYPEHSLDKQKLLPTNQIGYRSIHFVCDLGDQRAALPEFVELAGLKFEFQVRTVLQHAWAELAHDRNYKFTGKLPTEIERSLYLYAGLLEIADKGFSEIASNIENYLSSTFNKAAIGDFSSDVNSLSLIQFAEKWAADNNVTLTVGSHKDGFSDLVDELGQFGVHTLDDLRKLIPVDYANKMQGRETTVYGIVRDWMLIHDWRKYLERVNFGWILGDPDELAPIDEYLDDDEIHDLLRAFNEHEQRESEEQEDES